MFLMAFSLTTLWAWNVRHSNLNFKVDVDFLSGLTVLGQAPRLSYVVVFALGVWLAAYIGHIIASWLSAESQNNFSWKPVLATFMSGLIGSVILWWLATRILVSESFTITDGYNLILYTCFAVPVFLLIFLVAASLYVGFSSRLISDEDREWLARYGGWILVLSGVWIAVNMLVLIAPLGVDYLREKLGNRDGWYQVYASLISAVGVISGILSLLGGFSEKSQVRNEPVQTKTSRILALTLKPAAAIFLVFIMAGIAYLTSWSLAYIGRSINFLLTSNISNSSKHIDVLHSLSLRFMLISFGILALIGLAMACFVNVNKFSLHGMYRDRLIRAYLGASNRLRRKNLFTGFDDSDNFQLHRLRGQRPFHIFNATLNLVGGKTLAWQNRKAASFTMSALHCGSWILGYRKSNEYCRNPKLGACDRIEVCNRIGRACDGVEHCELPGKAIRLGTAMAISGAAANPNMGYISSPVLTFLMSLFNIRLGWWLGNTGRVGSNRDWFGWGKSCFFEKPSPSVAIFPLINETLGRTDVDKRFLNVTDGGHFENLAIYEMILRRCRFIVVSDGAADAAFKFGEISNAIQKCKVDLGVDIRFNKGINIFARDNDGDGKSEKVRYSVAEITYPEIDDEGNNLKGCLLYTRPAYYRDDEYTDIKYYADAHPTFPHQSTGDQMYDEQQFEAYRGLGFFTMEQIIRNKKYYNLEDFKSDLCAENKKE
ncbi:hypothetical protein BH20ACI2_BH20ACI2_22730 [soil metagenome]